MTWAAVEYSSVNLKFALVFMGGRCCLSHIFKVGDFPFMCLTEHFFLFLTDETDLILFIFVCSQGTLSVSRVAIVPHRNTYKVKIVMKH